MDRGRIASAVQTLALVLLAFDCLFPYTTERFPAAGMIVPALVWIAACAELFGPTPRPGMIAAWLSVPVLAGLTSYALSNLPDVVLAPLGTLPATLNQYLFVIPLGVAAGCVVGRGSGPVVLARAFRVFGSLSALLAIMERVTGHLVFSGNVVQTNFGTNGQSLGAALTGSGAVRGIVGSYHPLVLGALLAAIVPLALRAPRRWTVLEVPLLLAGIWATDSVGPLGIALAICAVRIVGLLRRRAPGPSVRSVMVGYVVAVVAFAVLALRVWTPVVGADDATDASTQYRFALFASLPRLLEDHPFGLGLGQLPAGTLLLESTGHPIDITASVDSELVVLVLQVGALGAAAFAIVLGLAVRNAAARAGNELGSWSLLALTASGLVLALHVWPAVAGLWAFLIGLGIAAAFERDGRGGDVAPGAPVEARTLEVPA